MKNYPVFHVSLEHAKEVVRNFHRRYPEKPGP